MMVWASWLKPRDASGRESRTLALVGIALMVLVIRFSLGGLGMTFGPISFNVEPMPALEFGGAAAAILSIWLGREWVKKEKPDA